ncbi:MAG: hypothetical protein IJ555_13045 [Ruminococcus sp.]|nr:hypothetical protein [Ruminococcus sp.]
MGEWRWKGSNEEFIEFFQWAMVFAEICRNPPNDWNLILTDKDLNARKAEELGMTVPAIVHEMVRIGSELEKTLAYENTQQGEE